GAFTDALVAVVGSVWFGLALTVASLALGFALRSVRPRMGVVVATGLLTLGLVHAARVVIWSVAPRTRPGREFRIEDSLRGASIETCEVHPDAWILRGRASPSVPSLPSSHVITAASLAV